MIAFDAAAVGSSGGTTALTFSHTCSGADRILFVEVVPSFNTDIVTGVTYNGVAMTRLGTGATGANYRNYIYALIAPATGANNVVVSLSSSKEIRASSASYTGVNQAALPANLNYWTTTTAATSAAPAITTAKDNSWVLMTLTALQTTTAGANTALRARGNTGSVDAAILDSNALVSPAGSRTLNANFTNSTADGFIVEIEVVASLPVVDTSAATDLAATTATGNGEITAEGADTPTERGFVWDTSSHGDPGNVAPASSGYADAETETGTFSTGTFTGSLTGLDFGTTYYCRAYAMNSVGYSYGDEVTFDTTDPWNNRAVANVGGGDGDPTALTKIFAEDIESLQRRLTALGG